MQLRYFLIIMLLATLALRAAAAGLTPAITTADIDLAHCQAFDGGKLINSPVAETLEALLGLRPAAGALPEWSTGKLAGQDRHFRLAFTHPVELGTICTDYTGGRSAETLLQYGAGTSVAYLKPTAAFPGEVSDAEQWVTLPPGAVKILPPGTRTQALLFTDRRVQFPWANLEWGAEASAMGCAVLLKERYYSALQAGNSKTLKTANGEGWIGYWPDALPIAGFVSLHHAAALARIYTLKAESTEHPTQAPPAQWQKLDEVAATGDGPLCWATPTPLPTRGLRLIAVQGRPQGNFPQVLPLVSLGPAGEPPVLNASAPYTIPYQMPLDGFIAVNITDKASGKPVRRLVAEVARLKGAIRESWDLKDNQGHWVAPGDYAWSALARPPLRLTYEGTVNNAGHPPWYAPVRGGGGWMSDHCTPVSIRALGDKVFMGTYGAEYGQSLIATDLEGNKLWAANIGADRLVTDGQVLYAVTPSGVTRIDPRKGFATRRLIDFTYSREVPKGQGYWGNFEAEGGAAAVSGDRLFVSYAAPSAPWLESSFTENVVDFAHCLPTPKPRPRDMDERFYDERMSFFAAFLTGSAPSSDYAGFGNTRKGGALAGTFTVSFTKPVPVGSILIPDGADKVYALKPGVKFSEIGLGEAQTEGPDDSMSTFDPFDDAQWIPLETRAKAGKPGLAVATPGVLTQALRFKATEVRYAMVLSRRYRDLAPEAMPVCGEGTIDRTGRWLVSRPATLPITNSNAPKMALVWQHPVSLRGAAIIAPTRYGALAVDYWSGPLTGNPAAELEDAGCWTQAGIVTARDSSLNCPQTPQAAMIDFGDNRQTRAIRIRLLSPAGSLVLGKPVVSGPHEGWVGAVLALSALAEQDPPLPPALNARITEVRLPPVEDMTTPATLVSHHPLPQPTFMTMDGAGALYAVSAGRIVAFPQGKLEAEPRVVVDREQLQLPRGLAFDADGLLYVIDAGPCVVKVFNPATGKLVRTIGTPGGFKLGPYDPLRFDNPVDLTIDSGGNLWVTDEFNQPKRITRWSRDGQLEKMFFGPTYYGGGGHIDPGNRSVVNYLGMKFVMDFTTHQWRLAARTNQPVDSPFADRVIYAHGHRYLVGDEPTSLFADRSGVVTIYEERNGIAVPLAAAGNLAAWKAVDSMPELREAFKTLDRSKYGFVWSDSNGDGLPQRGEVQLTERHDFRLPTLLGEDLSFLFRGSPAARLRPAKIDANGVPGYDINSLQLLPDMNGSIIATADGRMFELHDRLLAADGSTLWEYPDNYTTVQSTANAPGGFANRPPGVLVGELRIMGHFTAGNEELFVTNGNHGDWYALTADGLLAATIFGGPAGYGRRWWSMPACEPGVTDLSDLRLTVEDFYGSIAKCEDGHVYAVAGKNHNSIVRVDGLEDMQRLHGAVTVTPADLQQTKEWDVRQAMVTRAHQEPKIALFPEITTPPVIDGSLDDWPEPLFSTIDEVKNEQGKVTQGWYAALAYDNEKLYIAGRGSAATPMANSADDLTRVFQHGDGLDIQLGLDPKGDPRRTQPIAGDLRLVLTRVKGKPTVVLYRPVVPGTPPAQATIFTSPVGREIFDRVQVLADVEMRVTDGPIGNNLTGWIIEAAIPWKALGIAPPQLDQRLRGDFGVLIGDADGVATVRRSYWANTSQVILGDLPSEARLTPALWGELRCILPTDNLKFGGPGAQ